MFFLKLKERIKRFFKLVGLSFKRILPIYQVVFDGVVNLRAYV